MPANRCAATTEAIRLDAVQVYQVSPMDGTLRNLLARWARDSGSELDYRHHPGPAVPGDATALQSMAVLRLGTLFPLALILTMLIVSAPPMAAMFFNGVLGPFSPGNAVGVATGGGPAPPPGSGLPPGVAGRGG